MAIDKKLIDQLLTDYKQPEDSCGRNGVNLLQQAIQVGKGYRGGLWNSQSVGGAWVKMPASPKARR